MNDVLFELESVPQSKFPKSGNGWKYPFFLPKKYTCSKNSRDFFDVVSDVKFSGGFGPR
jgi:hypothetical protein